MGAVRRTLTFVPHSLSLSTQILARLSGAEGPTLVRAQPVYINTSQDSMHEMWPQCENLRPAGNVASHLPPADKRPPDPERVYAANADADLCRVFGARYGANTAYSKTFAIRHHAGQGSAGRTKGQNVCALFCETANKYEKVEDKQAKFITHSTQNYIQGIQSYRTEMDYTTETSDILKRNSNHLAIFCYQ